MGAHMTKPRTYTPELREEAVKLVLAQGLTLDEAAKRIAIPMGTLATWVKAAKRGNGAVTAPGSRTVPELEAEVARLGPYWSLAMLKIFSDWMRDVFQP